MLKLNALGIAKKHLMFELKKCVCLHAEDILSAAMCARSDNIMYK